MNKIKILGLSGSLRKNSYNTAAIDALKILAPDTIEILIGDISELPLFNPDREDEKIPPLEKLKSYLSQSSGLIIATPEYAHGISGPLKNALDWLVSSVEFPYKPIMLLNTSPRAHHAQKHLREVLTTMSGRIIEPACIAIPLLSSNLTCDGIIHNKDMTHTLHIALKALCSEIKAQKS